MIWRSITSFAALFLIALLEESFISALPGFLRLIPLIFVSGVLLYHFLRPNLGCAWLIAGGLLLDILGFADAPQVLAYGLAGLAGLFLARKVFTNHSLYATLGLGASMWTVVLIFETIWTALTQLVGNTPVPFSVFFDLFWARLLVFSLSLLLAFSLSRWAATIIKRQFLLRH